MYLLVLCGVVILIWYLQFLWQNRRLYWYSYKTPGPIGLPFIGIAYKFLTRDISVILQRVIDIQTSYPQVATIWFGPRLYYLVSKPEYIEKILTSRSALNKDHVYQFMSDVGEGLVTVGAKKWRTHRKTIIPSFNQKILEAYQDIFWNKAEQFTIVLQKEVENKKVPMLKLVSHCTMDIVCATTLGLNMNIQNSEEVEFITALEKLMEIISVRMLHVWHQLRFTWRLYPMSREFDKAFKIAKDFSSTLIANTKRKYESTRGNSSFEDDIALAVQGKHRDGISFLDLIYKNTKFSEQEITDEINTFLIAATDTTASGLCSIFTMLGMFQDIQQKVFEELIDILGPDRRAFPDDLPQLKYLERVVKESLRLFPPVPLIGRTLHEDIDGGDMIFPSSSSVIFGAVFIHRNPMYWPDPLKFDPDRFLPENTAKRHPCSYIPFSYGPRNCIGAKYAMMNMKTVLSAVLRKYKIFTEYKSVEEIKLSTSLILRLRDGPKVWIELR
ncbi:cytochrome P450 4C1-like isoform X8 [Diabrotica virgifera virgifera]|uniref:Cytochrome P450 4C1-like n=1 Tax=Diabrotica virgifera virgifera TaxID=50390 RepID=A0ABM5JZ17_DIAVI|nr:cytochrome P450 4C1-like isoform X4 [Diabrotica virgifera virgifera]XP_050503177.1 cytochrome P450 4C1-like isoform X5 [Diabrotica virgifera virgifera]XP_050503178.1 cytochrome P450 4C1-like isoform X6 [Diabrotica virgifera virgifera]XP_050503179.1 cytochrome P450 4C1-like isoform X7 [Diabrotica virgifera virgifera]XP_050503180.1 cytochrome P450 4C1-like isoform X8 [Diabrotica virgifera virgifera]XP_050503181.1 cytochrome P450 4C1-like isoform X9 [Diabrotica virgifera virgifera]XP_05050318